MARYKISAKGFMIFLAIMLFVVSAGSVSAASIALNPGSLRAENMVREGYAERNVRVTTNEDSIGVDVAFGEPGNEMNDWISLDPEDTSFNIGRGDPHSMRVIVEPPADVPNGNYSTSLVFLTRSEDEFTGVTGAVIDTAVAFRVNVRIVDDEVTNCNVLSTDIRNIEAGNELVNQLRIQNTGNIRFNPSIEIDIWNQEMSRLERTIFHDESMLLPTMTDEVIVEESSRGLSPGQYFADISVPECGFESTLTFDILEPGSISSDGNLVGIRVPAWNNRSDTIEINPVFENTGERAVTAYFEGLVRLDGNIVDRLETARLQVEPGVREEFEIFFSSDRPGRYEISGRVYYDNKRTFEKMNRFNILDQYSERDFTQDMEFGSGHLLIAIAAAILSLMIMIKNKKKKMRANRL